MAELVREAAVAGVLRAPDRPVALAPELEADARVLQPPIRTSCFACKHDVLIDDDASIRNLFAEELRYRGYSVIVARNGSEALDRLHLITPDVIGLDLMMPVMDGWTFVEHYRNYPAADRSRSLRCPRRETCPRSTKRSV